MCQLPVLLSGMRERLRQAIKQGQRQVERALALPLHLEYRWRVAVQSVDDQARAQQEIYS